MLPDAGRSSLTINLHVGDLDTRTPAWPEGSPLRRSSGLSYSVLLDGIVHAKAGTARYRESSGVYNHTVKLCLDDHDGVAGSIG